MSGTVLIQTKVLMILLTTVSKNHIGYHCVNPDQTETLQS